MAIFDEYGNSANHEFEILFPTKRIFGKVLCQHHQSGMFTADRSTRWRKSFRLQNTIFYRRALQKIKCSSFWVQKFEFQIFILKDLRHSIKKKISVLLSYEQAETVRSKIRNYNLTELYPSRRHQPPVQANGQTDFATKTVVPEVTGPNDCGNYVQRDYLRIVP